MQLWKLTAIDTHPAWEHTYDCAYGFVVRAISPKAARRAVVDAKQFGDEGPDVWLDPTATKCKQLNPDGRAGIVLRDYVQG